MSRGASQNRMGGSLCGVLSGGMERGRSGGMKKREWRGNGRLRKVVRKTV